MIVNSLILTAYIYNMIARNLIIAFLMLVSVPVISQGFQGGVTGGLNAARIDGDGHELWGKLGLNAGAFVSREIFPGMLSWQIELKYSSRGKYQGPTINDPGIDIIDLKYAELPLTLQYFVNEKIFIEFGFAPDILLKEEYADENGPVPSEYADELRPAGLTTLGSINYFLIDKLAVGLRFNYSVFPFYKFDAYAVRYRDTGWFHDVISINAKYYFVR